MCLFCQQSLLPGVLKEILLVPEITNLNFNPNKYKIQRQNFKEYDIYVQWFTNLNNYTLDPSIRHDFYF